MARRWIGREQMRLGDGEAHGSESLRESDVLIEWAEVDRHLAPIYAAAKGERAWPPLPLRGGPPRPAPLRFRAGS